jgi:hypothetical protein
MPKSRMLGALRAPSSARVYGEANEWDRTTGQSSDRLARVVEGLLDVQLGTGACGGWDEQKLYSYRFLLNPRLHFPTVFGAVLSPAFTIMQWLRCPMEYLFVLMNPSQLAHFEIWHSDSLP